MKKQLILPVLFLMYGTVTAICQPWFDSNSHWTSSIVVGWYGPGVEFVHIGGDTMVGGLTAKKYERQQDIISGPSSSWHRIIAQQGEQILIWSGEKFHRIYDFSMVTGDTLRVTKGAFNTPVLTYVVTETGVMNINNTQLRFQKISGFPVNEDPVTGMIIEKIGAVNFSRNNQVVGSHFFLDEPNQFSSDGTDFLFCSYSDNTVYYEETSAACADILIQDTCAANVLVQMVQAVECILPQVVATGEILLPCDAPAGFYQLPAGALALVKTTPHAGCVTICLQGTPVVIDCYEVNTSGTADGSAWETDISLYPNPANDVVYYDHFEKGTIRIVDMQGKKVHEVVVNGKKGLGIAHLPDGVFAVVFENEKGLLVKKLVVKRY